jgi:hypothetical protein
MMHPRDVMVAQEQRYERFIQDAEQWRLAKLARMGVGKRPNRVHVAWAWIRRLVGRRGRSREEEPRPVELALRRASE